MTTRSILALIAAALLIPATGFGQSDTPSIPRQQGDQVEDADNGDADNGDADNGDAEDKPLEAGSPREAFLAFFDGIVRGDVEAVRERMHTDGEDEKRLADMVVEMAQAVADIRAAVTEKFGEGAGDKMQVEGMPADAVRSMEEKVDGDTARLLMYPGDEQGAVLTKVDGKWKLSIADMIRQSKERGETVDDMIEDSRPQLEELKAIPAKVKAGEYKSPEEVAEATQVFRTEVEIDEDDGAGGGQVGKDRGDAKKNKDGL